MRNNFMEKAMSQQIKDLTLLLLWLTSWEEDSFGDEIRQSWKGYDFGVLNKLRGEGLIDSSYKAKSVYLIEKVIKAAKKLEKKYLSKNEKSS